MSETQTSVTQVKSAVTPEEIQKLKEDWLRDPHWDIEDGYEGEVRQELTAFRLEQEKIWEKRRESEVTMKAAQMKLDPELPQNRAIASYVLSLELRLCNYEERLSQLEARVE